MDEIEALNALLEDSIKNVLEDTADKFHLKPENPKTNEHEVERQNVSSREKALREVKSQYQDPPEDHYKYQVPNAEEEQYHSRYQPQWDYKPEHSSLGSSQSESSWGDNISQHRPIRDDQSQYRTPNIDRNYRNDQFKNKAPWVDNIGQNRQMWDDEPKYRPQRDDQSQYYTPRSDQTQYQTPIGNQLHYKPSSGDQLQYYDPRADTSQYRAPSGDQLQNQSLKESQSKYQGQVNDELHNQHLMNDQRQIQSRNSLFQTQAQRDQTAYNKTQQQGFSEEQQSYRKPERQQQSEKVNDVRKLDRLYNIKSVQSKDEQDSQESFLDKYERFRSQRKFLNQGQSRKKPASTNCDNYNEIEGVEESNRTTVTVKEPLDATIAAQPVGDTSPSPSKHRVEKQEPQQKEEEEPVVADKAEEEEKAIERPVVVSRKVWGALPSMATIPPFEPPADTVVFSFNTRTSPCDTPKECMRRVRELQARQMGEGLGDIQYSFLLGGDGYIYEGRGFQYESGAKKEGDEGSNINIAFIGSYKKEVKALPQKMIENAQNLIMYTHQVGLLKGARARHDIQDPKNNL